MTNFSKISKAFHLPIYSLKLAKRQLQRFYPESGYQLYLQRYKRGLSEEEFSEAIGFDLTNTRLLEGGYKRPSEEELDKLAIYFDLPRQVIAEHFRIEYLRHSLEYLDNPWYWTHQPDEQEEGMLSFFATPRLLELANAGISANERMTQLEIHKVSDKFLWRMQDDHLEQLMERIDFKRRLNQEKK